MASSKSQRTVHGTARINARVPGALSKQLQDLADQHRRSFAGELACAIDFYVKHNQGASA